MCTTTYSFSFYNTRDIKICAKIYTESRLVDDIAYHEFLLILLIYNLVDGIAYHEFLLILLIYNFYEVK